MLERVDNLRTERLDLTKLVSDLWGRFVEADPDSPVVRGDFKSMWSPIESEYELRSEPLAPPGLASDEHLNLALDNFSSWAQRCLDGDTTGLHD